MIKDLTIRMMISNFMEEFIIIIKIENHLNIKNENGGILAIFMNKNVKVKFGLGHIREDL